MNHVLTARFRAFTLIELLGLIGQTPVFLTTEFDRTPRVNDNDGRATTMRRQRDCGLGLAAPPFAVTSLLFMRAAGATGRDSTASI